jgi:hypothetical protein
MGSRANSRCNDDGQSACTQFTARGDLVTATRVEGEQRLLSKESNSEGYPPELPQIAWLGVELPSPGPAPPSALPA